MNDVLDVLKERRSIRKYKEDMPSRKELETLLEAGNWAPSDGNAQPWEFVVAKGKYITEVCNAFYESAQKHIPKATYIPEERKKLMLEYAKDFGGAPCHIIVTQPKVDSEFKQNEIVKACSACMQNILLQAHSMGLGTVWIDLDEPYMSKVASALNIADDRLVVGIIPVGYPAMNPPAPPRKELEVKWLGF